MLEGTSLALRSAAEGRTLKPANCFQFNRVKRAPSEGSVWGSSCSTAPAPTPVLLCHGSVAIAAACFSLLSRKDSVQCFCAFWVVNASISEMCVAMNQICCNPLSSCRTGVTFQELDRKTCVMWSCRLRWGILNSQIFHVFFPISGFASNSIPLGAEANGWWILFWSVTKWRVTMHDPLDWGCFNDFNAFYT